jgi:hypothetical protein
VLFQRASTISTLVTLAAIIGGCNMILGNEEGIAANGGASGASGRDGGGGTAGNVVDASGGAGSGGSGGTSAGNAGRDGAGGGDAGGGESGGRGGTDASGTGAAGGSGGMSGAGGVGGIGAGGVSDASADNRDSGITGGRDAGTVGTGGMSGTAGTANIDASIDEIADRSDVDARTSDGSSQDSRSDADEAAGDDSGTAVCGDGVVTPPERCDGDCQSKFNACVSDADTIRTRTGNVSDCSFFGTLTDRGCVNGDGFCPAGCTHATDTDCPKDLGEPCTNGPECRSTFCANSVCCDGPCNGACQACNLAVPGRCATIDFQSDPLNCGSCGSACSIANISPACSGGNCTGTCLGTFLDCNTDKRLDGCEIDGSNHPAHCGMCNHLCPYGVCQNSICAATKSGNPNPGPSALNRVANNAYCSPVTISTNAAGRLAALGVLTTGAGMALRLAIYTDNGGIPNVLIGQTGELTSVQGGPAEGLVTPVSVLAADYWICLVAPVDLQVSVEASTLPNWRIPFTYGPFPSPAPVAGGMQAMTPQPNVYAVTTP